MTAGGILLKIVQISLNLLYDFIKTGIINIKDILNKFYDVISEYFVTPKELASMTIRYYLLHQSNNRFLQISQG